MKYAPKIKVSAIGGTMSDGRIAEGSDVKYKCHADANPPEVTYRWYINDELVIGDFTTEMVSFAHFQTIPSCTEFPISACFASVYSQIIHNISRKYHDGLVKCEAHNAVGTSDESTSIDISCKLSARPRFFSHLIRVSIEIHQF